MAVKFPKSSGYDFRRDLVKRHKLVPMLEKFLSTEVEHFAFEYEPKQHDDAWHPSGACMTAPSELYYSVVDPGPAKVWGSAMLKTFMVGHFWHALLQHAVVELGVADPKAIEVRGMHGWGEKEIVTRERYDEHLTHIIAPGVETWQPFWKPFHWATGSGDVAPLVMPNGDEYVLDFKTMSSHQYKANSLPDWAAAKYEAQINVYMDWFNQERAIILCINKDTPHDMKEYEFVRNQPLIDAIYDKWEFVSECLDIGEAPAAQDDDHFDLSDLILGPVAQ